MLPIPGTRDPSLLLYIPRLQNSRLTSAVMLIIHLHARFCQVVLVFKLCAPRALGVPMSPMQAFVVFVDVGDCCRWCRLGHCVPCYCGHSGGGRSRCVGEAWRHRPRLHLLPVRLLLCTSGKAPCTLRVFSILWCHPASSQRHLTADSHWRRAWQCV